MANPSFTVNVKGSPVTFVSAFARLDEAYAFLAAQQTLSPFARDLMLRARQRNLSEKQVAWLHKLATDAQPVASLNLKPIVDMMQRAAAAQKRAPRIVLALGEGKVVLQVAMRGDRAGSVFIHNGGDAAALTQADRRKHYALLRTDGVVEKRPAWTPEVETLLRLLAANPAAVAQQHGVATGQCCFCGTALSTAESRSVGYGPVCADKFGLPWGDTSVADAADVVAKKAFDGLREDPATRDYKRELHGFPAADPRTVRLSSPNSGDRFQGD